MVKKKKKKKSRFNPPLLLCHGTQYFFNWLPFYETLKSKYQFSSLNIIPKIKREIFCLCDCLHKLTELHTHHLFSSHIFGLKSHILCVCVWSLMNFNHLIFSSPHQSRICRSSSPKWQRHHQQETNFSKLRY